MNISNFMLRSVDHNKKFFNFRAIVLFRKGTNCSFYLCMYMSMHITFFTSLHNNACSARNQILLLLMLFSVFSFIFCLIFVSRHLRANVISDLVYQISFGIYIEYQLT